MSNVWEVAFEKYQLEKGSDFKFHCEEKKFNKENEVQIWIISDKIFNFDFQTKKFTKATQFKSIIVFIPGGAFISTPSIAHV